MVAFNTISGLPAYDPHLEAIRQNARQVIDQKNLDELYHLRDNNHYLMLIIRRAERCIKDPLLRKVEIVGLQAEICTYIERKIRERECEIDQEVEQRVLREKFEARKNIVQKWSTIVFLAALSWGGCNYVVNKFGEQGQSSNAVQPEDATDGQKNPQEIGKEDGQTSVSSVKPPNAEDFFTTFTRDPHFHTEEEIRSTYDSILRDSIPMDRETGKILLDDEKAEPGKVYIHISAYTGQYKNLSPLHRAIVDAFPGENPIKRMIVNGVVSVDGRDVKAHY